MPVASPAQLPPYASDRPRLQINLRWAYAARIPEDRSNTHTVSGITTWHLKEGAVRLLTVDGEVKVSAPGVIVLGPGKRSHHFQGGTRLSSINCQIQSAHGPYLKIPSLVQVPTSFHLGNAMEVVTDCINRHKTNPTEPEQGLLQIEMHAVIAQWGYRLTEVLCALLDNPFALPVKHPGLARALAWLNEHPRDHTIREGELAQIAGLSLSHFKRLIQAETKQSFRDVMLERKLDACNDLLLRTNLPIKHIARELGFNSASNFVRWFQHHSSQTPAAYRKRHRAWGQSVGLQG